MQSVDWMHRVCVIIHARTRGASAELLANGNLSLQDLCSSAVSALYRGMELSMANVHYNYNGSAYGI